jgi:dienelactone hydrolase
MRRKIWRYLTLIVGLITLFAAGPAAWSAAASQQAATQELTFNFDGFQSRGLLSYPANAGPSPTVILIHGNAPGDLDYNLYGPDGALLSHMFKDIADYFTPRGIAVLRYNQRYVRSGTDIDLEKYFQTPRQQFLADAEQVLAAAERNPHVDRSRIYIYGYSEGTVVAANLVARHPEVAGLIMQGTLGVSWPAAVRYQYLDDALGYAMQFAENGKFTPGALE